MKRSRLSCALVVCGLLATPAIASAQDKAAPGPATSTGDGGGNYGPHARWMGISVGFPTGGAPTAGLTYFFSDTFATKFDVGLDIGKSASDAKAVGGFSLEAGFKIYFAKFGNLSPFAQPGVFLARRALPGDFFPAFVFQANGGLGAEYFFNDHLAFSAVTGLGIRIADDFETIKLTTGTSAIFASLYW